MCVYIYIYTYIYPAAPDHGQLYVGVHLDDLRVVDLPEVVPRRTDPSRVMCTSYNIISLSLSLSLYIYIYIYIYTYTYVTYHYYYYV